MRYIFWNGCPDDCYTANHFNGLLTNGVSFEDRNAKFEYTNVLYDYNLKYTKKLYYWLSRLTKYMFDFVKPYKDEEINLTKYMKYDDWWDQLQELIKKLEEHLKKHKKWES